MSTLPPPSADAPGPAAGAEESSGSAQTSHRLEYRTLLSLAIAGLILRVFAYHNYRFDSDEPQHLHVAWGWTAGLVQYRDLFDNHAPLFHMLSAPLLRWLGERPDILLFMRVPMVPLFLVSTTATYLLGKRLFNTRIALWATLLLVLYPPFFFKTLEYRTDNLWMAVWSLIVIVILRQPLRWPRLFALGFLLGVALCVSMKTVLLFVTLGGAALATMLLTDERRTARRALTPLLALLPGLAIMPTLIVIYFKSLNAWSGLVYCVVDFNKFLANTGAHIWIIRMAYPFLLAALIHAAYNRRHRVVDDATRMRFFWGLALGLFIVTLISFWLLISPRDFLPVMPIAAVFLASEIDKLPKRIPIFAGLAVLSLAFIIVRGRVFHDQTREHITMMHQVLALTHPGEPLMDLKGETIYRRRPFFYILELITRREMYAGMIADTIPEDMVRLRCHVAQADGPFLPERGARFLRENFLDMGRLRASGQWIRPDGSFDIAVPGDYEVLDRRGAVSGILDGTPLSGPRALQAGPHHFTTTGPTERLACLWAPAFARGFSPYHLKDRNF